MDIARGTRIEVIEKMNNGKKGEKEANRK